MWIYELVWPQDRIDHIARHGVRPEEVEQVCFGRPLVQRAKSLGENPAYYILGQSDAGRYLFCVLIRFPDGTVSGDGPANDREGKTSLPAVETEMKTQKLPQTDSIEELARFWDTHDLTDFEDQLEEVTEPVFERGAVIPVCLDSVAAEAVRRIAKAKGVGEAELVRGWILEKVANG